MPPRLAKRLLRTGVILAVLALAAARAEEAATPRAPAPARPADLQAPTEPVAKAAFAVIEKHCSRCHQAGMLTAREKPAKNFGNILRLDEIAADPHLIQPGNPEGLEDLPADQQQGDALRPLLRVRHDEARGDGGRYRCAARLDRLDRRYRGEGLHRPTISSRRRTSSRRSRPGPQVQPARRAPACATSRLANLYNSCASDEAMEVYRQGAVKLLNSLSAASDVVTRHHRRSCADGPRLQPGGPRLGAMPTGTPSSPISLCDEAAGHG